MWKCLGAYIIIALLSAACTVEHIPVPAGPAPIAPAVLTTSAQGAEAVSAILKSKELLVTSTSVFRDLGFIAQSTMVAASSGTGSGSCADYGDYSFDRTYSSSPGNYSVTLTMNLCRQNEFQYDGTFSASGTSAQFTIDLSSLKILNFKNKYTILIGSLVGDGLSFSMQGTGPASNATYTFSASGGLQAFDYYTIGQNAMKFNNLVANYVSTDASNVRTTSFLANGKYSVTQSSSTGSITYTDFKVDQQTQLLTNVQDTSMTGMIAVAYSPHSGVEGTLDVTTATPVTAVSTTFPTVTTGGQFTINDAASAQYGASDTISVSVTGDATVLDFLKEFVLMKQSSFYAMEQQLPIVTGSTGTASGTIMSISALSTGVTQSDLNCYTDVHVNYYTQTSPVPADTILWYVDWHTDMSTCTTSTIPFEQATSSTGVSSDPCDVGLDINGFALDITSGGVEHFLAANLPAGYYVVSINNYSCASANVTNDATIVIGDYLFGPYHCSYTASDLEYVHDPNAWCRIVDVQVDATGGVTVITPDILLPPWHP